MSNHEASDPSDVTGLPLKPNEYAPGGEHDGRQAVARQLGLSGQDTTDDDDEGDDDDIDDDGDDTDDDDEDAGAKNQKGKKSTDRFQRKPSKAELELQGKQSGKEGGKQKPKIVDDYSETIQARAEEAYAWTLNRVQKDPEYLDNLVQSKDPIDLKLARKLLARNDFGAKTVEEYRVQIRMKKAGDDPVQQELVRLNSEVERLTEGSRSANWKNWKKEYSVGGEAAEIADAIHAEYPEMPYEDVLSMTRGKLGVAELPSMKEQVGHVRSGGDMGQGENLNMSSPLAKSLLPNVKQTKKFAKRYMRGRR